MTSGVSAVRSQFPYYSSPGACNLPVFMENAGGSQCPAVVIDSIADYMRQSYVQLDAGYELSRKATSVVVAAHDFMKDYMNARKTGEIVFGASTSQLLRTLSCCYSKILVSGGSDEVVVQESNHEANAGPWVQLAEHVGLTLKFWPVDCDTFEQRLESLEALLSERTRIVAVAHVSNLLGGILPLKECVELVKSRTNGKARVVVDGVAFAPHRALDVEKWGVDWYVFSSYKVYGPHMAVLYGTHDAFEELDGPNFYFVPRTDARYKFELGGVNHESCAGVLALWDYLKFLVTIGEEQLNKEGGAVGDRGIIEAAFRNVISLEDPLQKILLTYLNSKPDAVVVVGPVSASVEDRVPTVSFVHKTRTSSEIAKAVQSAGFAIRNGHMYAHRLISGLHAKGKLYNNSIKDGVVRVSMVHYNTAAEVEALCQCLGTIL